MTVELFSVFGDTHQQEKDRQVFDSALAAAWSFVQIFIIFFYKKEEEMFHWLADFVFMSYDIMSEILSAKLGSVCREFSVVADSFFFYES